MINRACGQQFIGITRQPPRPVGEKGKDASKALLDGKESEPSRHHIDMAPRAAFQEASAQAPFVSVQRFPLTFQPGAWLQNYADPYCHVTPTAWRMAPGENWLASVIPALQKQPLSQRRSLESSPDYRCPSLYVEEPTRVPILLATAGRRARE